MDKVTTFTAAAVSQLRSHGLRQATADARARWDNDHLVNMQCRVTMEEARQIDDLCGYLRCTRYRLVRSLLLACLAAPRDPGPFEEADPAADLEIIQDRACEILDQVAVMMASLDEARLIQAENRETAALLASHVEQLEGEARGSQRSGSDAPPWEEVSR